MLNARPGVQAGQDPNRAAFIAANCKSPGAATSSSRRRTGRTRGGRAGAPPAAQTEQEYTVTAIPGVIAAGQRWKVVWEDKGNNADGPVGMDDGSLWIAQNDKSDVVRIDKDGKASVIYTDTYTGGTIAANRKGTGLHRRARIASGDLAVETGASIVRERVQG
jgi:hypothetical protein